MASAKRISTGYKGVFYIERKGEKILCIFYRKPGDRKQYEEKLGISAQGWTPARANAERSRRINGQELTNNERRQAQLEAKRNAESRPTIERLWQLYLASKGDQIKGVVTDKNRFDLHLRKPVGNKTPQELVPLDIERLRRQVAKSHSIAPPAMCLSYYVASSTLEFVSAIVPHSIGPLSCQNQIRRVNVLKC